MSTWRTIPGLVSVVNNHGFHKSPFRIRQRGTPSKWPIFPWLINGGDPTHLLARMILEVPPPWRTNSCNLQLHHHSETIWKTNHFQLPGSFHRKCTFSISQAKKQSHLD